jgi:hypothetical protein
MEKDTDPLMTGGKWKQGRFMSRSNCKILDNGDSFPAMGCNAVDGRRIVLPDDFGERWNVLLFYRGHW